MIAYAAALLLMSQTAEPANARADAACVIARVPVAQREIIATTIITSPDAPESITDPITAAANACAAEGGWQPTRAAGAVVLAISVVMQDTVSARLTALQIDPRQIDAWFVRQPQADRVNAQMTDAVIDRLLAHLGGVSPSEDILAANGNLVGAYFGTLVLAERIRLGLPIE